jgi:hypothetical protein
MNLLDKIERAQIHAGEQAVSDHLKEIGLMPKDEVMNEYEKGFAEGWTARNKEVFAEINTCLRIIEQLINKPTAVESLIELRDKLKGGRC